LTFKSAPDLEVEVKAGEVSGKVVEDLKRICGKQDQGWT
jgi:hypothetical protein